MILLRDSRIIGETYRRTMILANFQATMGLPTKVGEKVVSPREKSGTAK